MIRNNSSILLLAFAIFIFWIRQCFGLRNVLIMHDGGPDDFNSFVFTECQNDLNVRFVDVTPADSHKKAAAWVTKQCLDYLGFKPTIISANDFEGINAFPDTWRNDAKILSKMSIFNNTRHINVNRIYLTKATERLVYFLSGDKKYTLLVTGPFSNLAAAITKCPAIINNIDRIYAMGGAIKAIGNVHINGSTLPAEWNIYNNPRAANVVFRSGIPITLIPLDVTNQAPVSKDFLQSLYSQRSDAARLISAIYKVVESFIEEKLYFWDILAAAALVDPKLFKTKKMNISVVLTGDAQGQTLKRNDGTTLDVATTVDLEKFQKLMFRTLQNCKRFEKLENNNYHRHKMLYLTN